MDEHHRRGYRKGLRRNRPRRMGYGWLPGVWAASSTQTARQGPEEGEEVETTAPPTKDARGLKHAAIDNCIDVNGDEHDELGLFTGSNSILLQNATHH